MVVFHLEATSHLFLPFQSQTCVHPVKQHFGKHNGADHLLRRSLGRGDRLRGSVHGLSTDPAEADS